MIFYRWRRFIKKAQTYKVDKATRFKLCPSTKSYKMLCFSLQKTYLSSITNIDRKTNDTNWMEERSNALESELPVRDFDLLIRRISRHAENLVGIPTCGPRRGTSHISLRHPPPLSANPTKSGRSAEPEAAANRTGNGDLLVRLGQPMRPRKEEQSSVEGIDSPLNLRLRRRRNRTSGIRRKGLSYIIWSCDDGTPSRYAVEESGR